MVHAADEVVNAVVASVNERVLAVHDGHKSESRYIIKQVHSHLRLVACAWSVSPDHAGEGAPSPLDKTLPSGSSCSCLHLHALLPAPACTTACACSTHILLNLSFVMSGSGGYFASLAPAMSKVLPPGAVRDVVPSEVSSSLSVSKETCAFIPKNHDVIKPLFRSMTSSFCILIGCQGNSDAP